MTETTAPTAPEALNTAPVVVEQQELTTPEPTDGGGETQPTEKTPDQLRIDQLERDLAAERRRVVKRDRTQGKLYQELQQARQYAPQPTGEQPAPDPMVLAEQIADLKLHVRETTDKSNKVDADGRKRFPDFHDSLSRVTEEIGALFDGYGRPTPMGDAVLDSDDPAALLHYLGKNLDVAAELAELRPGQVGRRLERIEAQMKAKPEISTAPKPLQPVNARAVARPAESRLSDDELVRSIKQARK